MGANPESSDDDECLWIPGPALTRRPGMTPIANFRSSNVLPHESSR
jgi:hypothetical protein